MTVAVSGHDLLRTRLCAHKGCEDDGEVQVEGDWYCARHVPARRNGAPAPARTEAPATVDPRTCSAAGCEQPGVWRTGRGKGAWYCEYHREERRQRISEGARRRHAPDGDGALADVAKQLVPLARTVDQARRRHHAAAEAERSARAALDGARQAWRKALDEVDVDDDAARA